MTGKMVKGGGCEGSRWERSVWKKRDSYSGYLIVTYIRCNKLDREEGSYEERGRKTERLFVTDGRADWCISLGGCGDVGEGEVGGGFEIWDMGYEGYLRWWVAGGRVVMKKGGRKAYLEQIDFID